MSAESTPGTSDNLNTVALEGCPFVSQRGDVLYFASNRPGSTPVPGGTASSIDIWYSLRTADGGWGDPVNFGAVNSPFTEVCPSAHRNAKDFLFVSNRPDGCGGSDIYRTRLHPGSGTWAAPENLGCTLNSPAEEASPYLLEDELYFGSMRAGGFSSTGDGPVSGDADIYVSAFDGQSFGEPELAEGLNTSSHDFRPNLRRDGLEIFLDSTRRAGWVTSTSGRRRGRARPQRGRRPRTSGPASTPPRASIARRSRGTVRPSTWAPTAPVARAFSTSTSPRAPRSPARSLRRRADSCGLA